MADTEPGKRGRGEHFSARVTVLHQFRALFLKDLTLQWRAIGTNLCQLLTPIIFILFAGIMQFVVNLILNRHGTPIPGTEVPIFPPSQPGRTISCRYREDNGSSPHHPVGCRNSAFNFFLDYPDWEELLDDLPPVIRNQTDPALWNETVEAIKNLSHYSQEPCPKYLFDFPMFYVGTAPDVELELGNITADDETQEINRTGFLGGAVPDAWYYNFSMHFNITERHHDQCEVDKGPFLHLPMFVKLDNQTALNDRLINVVQDYNALAHGSSANFDQYDRSYSISPLSPKQLETVLGYIQQRQFDKLKPHGGVFIDGYSDTDGAVDLNYSMVADELVLYKLRQGANSTSIQVEVQRRSNIVNWMSNAVFKYLLGMNETEAGADFLISTSIMPLPTPVTNITIDITTLIGGLLYPFAASFLIPVFMSVLVKDKFEKHLTMMEQNGLSRWTYWLVTYTFHFLLYVPVAIEIFVFSLLFKIRMFTQTNGLVLILTFFLWGHAEVVLGFFLSNFFSRPRTATIVGYLLVIAGVIIALLLEGLQILPNDETPFPVYMLYPPFAFYRILFYINYTCLGMNCYGIDILSGLNLVTTAMLYLVGSTVALMLASVYLSYVLPSEYGIRKSPFFPLIALYKGIRCVYVKCSGMKRRSIYRELPASPPGERVVLPDEEVDEDVIAEEEAVRNGFHGNTPVVMYQLRKEYGGSPPHIAVHGMSLAIQRGECFGLLGPNGAGKTTLISVLTGLYEPTLGHASIAGYDITSESAEVHSRLGVCPQFDIQHADLTTEEHLLFYARLKGVKWRSERGHVERTLRQVNLYDARNKKSKALSGGMRRRLSVAMATVGNPDILILDEPTTGLDPASRRQVWEVLENIKDGRCVILTTHAMEEADHLCTRIGIMDYGRLRCLGTQSRLKAKFGSGYQLALHAAPGRAREVQEFVQQQLPRAEHVETYADSCSYKLEKEELVVSELFQLLDSAKTRVGILDWGLKMTTLEDVFLNIVKQNRDHRTPLEHNCCPGWLPCLKNNGGTTAAVVDQ